MLEVNFFETIINITLTIDNDELITAANSGKTLFTTDQFTCISKLRMMINEVGRIADKHIVFTIINKTTKDPAVANSIKGYLKSNLEMINSSTNCHLEVKTGLYNLLA